MPSNKENDVVSRRRHNLKSWIDDKFNGVQAAFVERTGINQGELSALLKTKSFGEKKARALEKQANMQHGYLDSIPGDSLRQEGAQRIRTPTRVWVIGNGQGGLPDRIWTDGDHPVGSSDRFAEVATDDQHAFVVCVRGDSMVPRYQPGEYALVEPSTVPDIEDDVLVRLATGETMIKRLLSRRGGIRLGSYNSADVMTYEDEAISWMYYVAHPIPARKIKHWVEADEYEGQERRQETAPHSPERRGVPKPMSERDHVFGKPGHNKKRRTR